MRVRNRNPLWTRLENATNAAAMPQRSHFDKLVEDEQRDIIQALLGSAARGDMARSAFLAGKHDGLTKAVELQRTATRVGADPDDTDGI